MRLGTSRAARIALSIALLALLVRQVGLQDTMNGLARLQAPFVAFGLTLLIAEVLTRALNWRQLCRATQCFMSVRDVLYAYFAGSFLGSFVPSTLGTDAVRAALAAARTGCRMEILLATTVSLNLVSLAAAGILGLSAGTYLALQQVEAGSVLAISCGVSALCLAGIAVLALLSHWQRGRRTAEREHEAVTWTRKVLRAVDGFIRALMPLHGWTLALRVLTVASFSYLLRLTVIYVLLIGLGAQLSIAGMLVAGPLLILGAVLPISIAGFGGQQVISVYVLGSLGVPGEAALAASLMHSSLYVIFNLGGAIAYASARSTAPQRQAVSRAMRNR